MTRASSRGAKEALWFSQLEIFRLRNGPALLVLPDPDAPVAAVQAWLPAGGATEAAGEEGISHFLEHMIFKGSRGLGMGELASRTEEAGGDINAYTASDATYYDLTCLPRGLEGCLDALAEALWWPRLDREEVDRERGVILEEINRGKDQPEQRLQKHLYRRAYGRAHPYARPILGSPASLRRMDAGVLRRYHRRIYHPAGAVVVVAGPVEPALALSLLKRKLRPRAAPPPPGPGRPGRAGVPGSSPEGAGPRTFLLRGRAGLAHMEIAFSIPGFHHPDTPALEVLSMILGSGESSRLFKRLCVESPLMHDVSTDLFSPLGPGLLFLGGVARPAGLERASEEILRVVRAVAGEHPPEEDEVRRVKTNYLTEVEFRRESVSGRARVAGYFQLLYGDVGVAEEHLRRIQRVTAGEVRRVARTYFWPEALTAGVLLPTGANFAGGARFLRRAVSRGFSARPARRPAGPKPERGAPPAGGRAAAPPPPRRAASGRRSPRGSFRRGGGPVRARLPGGGRLLVLPGGPSRVFSIRAVFLGGQRLEGADRAGLHAFMSNVAPMATRSMPSETLARHVEGLGASVGGFSGRNSFGLYASGLSSFFPELLEVFAEVLCRPAFAPGDVALARREINAERRSESDDLALIARLRVMSILYGRHPFGRHPLGSRAATSRLDRASLRRAWRRWTAPANLVLGAAGDVDPAWFSRALGKILKGWARRAPAWRAPRPPDPPLPAGRLRTRAHTVKGASQSHLCVGYLGATFHDPRRYALSVLAAVLGSQGGGLFWELRERRGLAYEVNVSSEEAMDPGPVLFYAATAPGNEGRALDVIRSEVRRAGAGGIRPEEIDRAKAYLIGDYFRGYQRASLRTSELVFSELYGLDWEGPEAYRERIEAVDAAAVRRAAADFLPPEGGCVVCLGPAAARLSPKGRARG